MSRLKFPTAPLLVLLLLVSLAAALPARGTPARPTTTATPTPADSAFFAAVGPLALDDNKPAESPTPAPTLKPLPADNPLALDDNVSPTGMAPTPAKGVPLAPPSNDDMSGAIAAVTLPFTYTEHVLEATLASTDPPQSCSYGGARQNKHSVWFQYNAGANGNAPLTAYTTGSDYDTVLTVYNDPLAASEIACNDDYSGLGLQSKVFFTTTLLTNYYIEVTSYNTLTSNTADNLRITLRSAARPPHDDFNNAITIATTPYTHTVDTFNATRASDDPNFPGSCSGSTPGATVWYRYQPTQSGRLTIDTVGTDYDTILSVWTGSRGYLTNQGCYDDPAAQSSVLRVPITAGVTYYVMVAAKGGTTPGNNLQFHARVVIPQWQPRTPLDLARTRLGMTSDGTYLYVLGGEIYTNLGPAPDAYIATNRVSRYDAAQNSWSSLTNMPIAMQNHQAVYVSGKIYIPAGYTTSGPPFYGTHLVYDIATDSWSTAANAPWPNGRAPIFYSLASDGQGYYLTGGYDGAQILNRVWYYSVANNTWTARAAMPTPRYGHTSAVIGGRLYVVAGDNDTTTPGLFSTERYNPTDNTWVQLSAQHQDRVYPSSAVLPASNSPGQWYLTGGGYSSYGSSVGSTEIFDPLNGIWQLLPEEYTLTVPRYLLGGAAISNVFYTTGGTNNSVPSLHDDHERLVRPVPTAVEVTALSAANAPVALASVLAVIIFTLAVIALARRRQ